MPTDVENRDGPQKIHYSQQEPGLKPGAHSRTVEVNEFVNFYKRLKRPQPDIMLEVKVRIFQPGNV
jgi:UV DNA damage endonuclease